MQINNYRLIIIIYKIIIFLYKIRLLRLFINWCISRNFIFKYQENKIKIRTISAYKWDNTYRQIKKNCNI
jgi:hypothetical protein